MKIFNEFLSAAVVALMAISCTSKPLDETDQNNPDLQPEPTPEVTLSFSPETVKLAGLKDSFSEVIIQSNQNDFSLSFEEELSWVKAERMGKIIKVIALESNETGASRSAALTIVAGTGELTKSAVLTIEQADAGDVEVPVEFIVPVTNAELAYTAGATVELEFTSNKEVVFELDEAAKAWLDVQILEGKVKLTSKTENNTDAAYAATVKLTAGEGANSISTNINVTQLSSNSPKYKVGDVYEGGIIFRVNEDSFDMISLQQAQTFWCTELSDSNNNRATGATDQADGAKNTLTIKNYKDYSEELFPAVAFCLSLGEGWYMPAIKELEQFHQIILKYGFDAFNSKIVENDGTAIPLKSDGKGEYHFSSTEVPEDFARKAKTFRISKVEDTRANQSYAKESSARYVRAFKRVNF